MKTIGKPLVLSQEHEKTIEYMWNLGHKRELDRHRAPACLHYGIECSDIHSGLKILSVEDFQLVERRYLGH